MNRALAFCLLVIFFAVPSFAVHVAVLETIASQDALGLSERQYLTDELRAQAVRALPAEMNFTIMTRENIIAMLPPGKSIEQCEGSCLVETGKNISADYVAQGRVGWFGKDLTLTVEFYETAGAKLVGSFTAKSADAEGLLESIKKQSPGLFAKARGSGSVGVNAGINGFSGTSGFSVGAQKNVIVRVNTTPAGAMLSLDGRPVTTCRGTPCNVQMATGEHRFLAVLESYDDLDTVFTASGNGQALNLTMISNFGILTIKPKFSDGYEQKGNLAITIDGSTAKQGENKLAPGNHLVEISHPCYEPVKFSVGIAKNSTVLFDSSLTVAVGGVSLNATRNEEPQIVPVKVNGVDVGSTPFLGEVPLCAKITVGETRRPIPVRLKYHETVEYTQVLTALADKAALANSAAASAAKRADSGSHVKVAPIVLMALGTISIGSGFYEYMQLKKERRRYDNLYYPSQDEAASQWNKVQQAKNLQYGFYGAGVALLGAGLVWTFAF